MGKIQRVIMYEGMKFKLSSQKNNLFLYVLIEDENYCIIVDRKDNVIFEIQACSAQNIGYLKDLTNKNS